MCSRHNGFTLCKHQCTPYWAMRSKATMATRSSTQVGAANKWSKPTSLVADQTKTPTDAAPKAELMAIVVAKKVKLVRVCLHERNPP